jgi:hypothetical protein
MGSELLVILLPGGALFGVGAAWVVFRASAGRSAWARSFSVAAVLLACVAAPLLFFMLLGTIARFTQPVIKASLPAIGYAAKNSSSLAVPRLRPNPSLKLSPNGVAH